MTKMEFELGTKKQVNYFGDILDLLLTISEEIPLYFTPENMVVNGMDGSHVAMIDLKLDKSNFEVFDIELPKDKDKLVLVPNLKEFKKRIESINPDTETARIYYNTEKERIAIHIKDFNTYRRRELEIPLMEAMEEDAPDPKIFFHGKGEIHITDFERALIDSGFVSEHVRILFEEEKLRFEAEGDSGSSFLELPKDQVKGFSVKNDEGKVVATYTLSWIANPVGKLKKLFDKVEINMASDMPLLLEAKNPGKLECKYYLAPCIGV